MGKEWTIGKKTIAGFGITIAIFSAGSVITILGTRHIAHDAKEVIGGNELDATLAQREIDHLNWANKVAELFSNDSMKELAVETDDHKCGFGRWLYGEGRSMAEHLAPALAPMLKQIEEPHRKLHQSAAQIGKIFRRADPTLAALFADLKARHLEYLNSVRDAFLGADSSRTKKVEFKDCALGKWLYSSAAEEFKKIHEEFGPIWTDLEASHRKLHQGVNTSVDLLSAGKTQEAVRLFEAEAHLAAEGTLEGLDKLLAWQDQELEDMRKAQAIYAAETVPALAAVREHLKKIREEAKRHILTDEGMLKAVKDTNLMVVILGILGAAAGLLAAFLTVKSVARRLNSVAAVMQRSANGIAAVSQQIATSSQSLAQSAAEQAAAAEETASSLQEITGAAAKTSEMTQGTSELMSQNIYKTGQSLKALAELTANMTQIESDSGQILGIMKTIDEIALQTNLLALNAAVEAARAGEMGAGFAVVADEVRALAKRAAEAAKNTQSLLVTTMGRIESSAKSIRKINSDFEGIVESATIMGEKSDAITEASKQQARNIEEIGKASQQMGQATSEVAAAAEESAAAGESLLNQADEMERNVNDLLRLVHGEARHMKSEKPAQPHPSPSSDAGFDASTLDYAQWQ